MHGHHQLCRVVVGKEVVGYRTDFSPEWLVGTNDAGEETRIDMTVFGGRQVPIEDWVMRHG